MGTVCDDAAASATGASDGTGCVPGRTAAGSTSTQNTIDRFFARYILAESSDALDRPGRLRQIGVIHGVHFEKLCIRYGLREISPEPDRYREVAGEVDDQRRHPKVRQQ